LHTKAQALTEALAKTRWQLNRLFTTEQVDHVPYAVVDRGAVMAVPQMGVGCPLQELRPLQRDPRWHKKCSEAGWRWKGFRAPRRFEPPILRQTRSIPGHQQIQKRALVEAFVCDSSLARREHSPDSVAHLAALSDGRHRNSCDHTINFSYLCHKLMFLKVFVISEKRIMHWTLTGAWRYCAPRWLPGRCT
jgi:hypothetical protein